MSALQAFALDWLPPAMLRWVRRQRGGIRFTGPFPDWATAAARCTGYDAASILAKVLAATLQVKRGEAVFERDSVVFHQAEYVWPVLAGLMGAAARSGGKLNVLDFGGALGSTYFQHRPWLQGLPEVHWNIVEQAHYVAAGQAHIQDAQLRFYPTLAACLAENQPNVVLLSGVLQYLESPWAILAVLRAVGAEFLIIARTPFGALTTDRLLVQQVPVTIYPASYPMWVFAQAPFAQQWAPDWRLLAETLDPEGRMALPGGGVFCFQTVLWEARR